MDSLKELYKVGNGPSSSHTMGPQKAAKIFMTRTPAAARYRVTLLGSLAATGKGHLTDWIIEQTLGSERTEIIWKPDEVRPFHTNGMIFEALDEHGAAMDSWEVYSVGGGTIAEADAPNRGAEALYPHTTLTAIMGHCKANSLELWQYVEKQEGQELWSFLKNIWQAMLESIERGLECTGVLPGALRYPRKANTFFKKARTQSGHLRSVGKTFAYALAVAEENASGGKVVTAPTCGSAGLIPAVLHSLQEDYALGEREILRALAVGGLIGNLVKENASISGAEVGCQGEIGTACAMAGAIAAYLFGGSLMQIDYAAEMSLEHHLGMTCDPVGGYVQVPCIERNAISSVRAINAAEYALFTDGAHHISFDQVVQTMGETGRDLKCGYRETSLAGLAKHGIMANCGKLQYRPPVKPEACIRVPCKETSNNEFPIPDLRVSKPRLRFQTQSTGMNSTSDFSARENQSAAISQTTNILLVERMSSPSFSNIIGKSFTNVYDEFQKFWKHADTSIISSSIFP